MLKCADWPIGVCSWSLQTDIADVADLMNQTGITHVHLAVAPAVGQKGADYLAAVKKQSWTISSTMVAFDSEDYSSLESIKLTGGVLPDEPWPKNCQLALEAVNITADLGVKFLAMHAGFIDHSDPKYVKKFFDRIRLLADAAAKKSITLLLETGQETADELKQFLQDLNHPAVGVNFDPANMILYDRGNPIDAVKVLAPWVKHIHIKDANRTQVPGTWGAEVPWGDGQVNTSAFLQALKQVGFQGTLAIEREAGNDRHGDIKLAAERLSSFSL